MALATSGSAAGWGRNEAQQAMHKIARGMPLAPSIDYFLDTHREDRAVETCGKIGIASAILEAERASPLYYDQGNIYNIPAFGRMGDTWFILFWSLLVSGIELATVHEMFRNVAFIVFNYDRCVEQFLSEALKSYFFLDDATVMEVLATVDIFHPYGTIGDHPLWRRGGVMFGAEPSASQLKQIAQRVKTFTERIEEGEELRRMRDSLAAASRLVFLGFGYHDPNMRLLRPETATNASTVFGTAKGFSEADLSIVRGLVRTLISDPPPSGLPDAVYPPSGRSIGRSLEIQSMPLQLQDCTCAELFRRFSLSIGA